MIKAEQKTKRKIKELLKKGFSINQIIEELYNLNLNRSSNEEILFIIEGVLKKPISTIQTHN